MENGYYWVDSTFPCNNIVCKFDRNGTGILPQPYISSYKKFTTRFYDYYAIVPYDTDIPECNIRRCSYGGTLDCAIQLCKKVNGAVPFLFDNEESELDSKKIFLKLINFVLIFLLL